MFSHPATSALDAAAVAAGLATARVLEPSKLDGLLATFCMNYDPASGEAFAELLVQQGLLTPYQAQAALAGEAERLNVGPFVLLDTLGGNSLGNTCRAMHRTECSRFVVRVMPLRSLWKAREAKRYVAQLAALPAHPTLVRMTDADTADGVHYLAWPFTDGESLLRAVASGPLPAETAARLFAELAEGLAICHAAGVVHGLLKPSAILIASDNHVRLLDLGLGDVLADGEDDDSLFDTISTSNAAVERMDFTPPEVAADPTVRTPASDAYSFGALMYLAVTGEPPFPDGSVVDKMISHQRRNALPVRMRNPHVPQAVAGLIERLLAKLPADRPTLSMVRDELRAHAESTPEPQTISVTASTLRDAAALSKSFQLRSRTIAPRDTEGAVDFDLPVSTTPPPEPELVPAPKPAHKPVLPPMDTPRRIPISAAPVTPNRSETVPPKKSTGESTRSPRASGALPRPADLPRPVGWDSERAKKEGDSAVRPKVVIPSPPRRTVTGGLARSLSFWRSHADDVQLSVFGPPEIAPGQRVKFIVYAHLPAVSDNVVTLCRAMHKTTELLGAGHVKDLVVRGSSISLHLTLTSAGVAKSQVSFPWAGQPQPKTFDVFVPWESPPGLTAGTLSAAVDDAPAAIVAVHFVVLPRGR